MSPMDPLSGKQPAADWQPVAPHYRYDPNAGQREASYHQVDWMRTKNLRPELPGVFVVQVDGETFVPLLTGRRIASWTIGPGTPCVILGHWSDGTVHVRWEGIHEHYWVDGRFPAWVVAEVSEPIDDPRILRANFKAGRVRRRPSGWLSRLRQLLGSEPSPPGIDRRSVGTPNGDGRGGQPAAR